MVTRHFEAVTAFGVASRAEGYATLPVRRAR
jgi:hypothetical protein